MAKNMTRRAFPRGGIRTRLPVTIYRQASDEFSPRSISGLALWLDASSSDLYTTDAGPVTAVASPLDIAGCQLWLDASDPASITASGGEVTAWADKSATGSSWTRVGGANGPATGTQTMGGKNVVVFDGTNDGLSAVAPLNTSMPLTFFVVQRVVTGSVAGMTYTAGAGDNFNWRQAADTLGTLEVTVGGSRMQLGGALLSQNTLYSLTVPASSNASIYRDGTVVSITTNAALKPTLTGTHYLGRRVDGFYANVHIAEIVAYSAELTPSQRARVEAYLASKWGISGVHAPATASSDPVGYWGDKSGNGRHAVQATAGSRPSRSVAINTRSAVLLANGAVQRLTANGVYMDALGDDANKRITIFAALQSSSQSQQKSIGEVDQGSGFGCYHNISNIAYFDAGAGAPASRASGALASSVITGGAIFIGRRDGGAVDQWYNGALIAGSLTSATGSLRTAGDNPFSVKAVNSGSLAYGEVLIYNRALTTAERQRAERYLAARWGITLAPQVANADAQNWIDRVYANGGTVSSATAAAVNTFCDSIASAGIRDRFYRLNLFCGSGLNAALVPLFRGPSLGGTQYGNATDTNNNFVSGDYSESGGLTSASASTKTLLTGVSPMASGGPLFNYGHYFAHVIALPAARSDVMGVRKDPAPGNQHWLQLDNTGQMWGGWCQVNRWNASASGVSAGKTIIMQAAQVANASQVYASGLLTLTAAIGTSTGTASEGANIFSGRTDFGAGFTNSTYSTMQMGAYSIGLDFTASQALAYHTAYAALATALSRTIA